MAYFGSKVLHPSTLKPAQERNIPVLVKNMFTPEETGTRIIRESAQTQKALAVSFKEDIALLTVSAYETVMGYNFLTRVFKVLEDHRLAVDAVNTTEASVTIALSDSEKLDEIAKSLIEIGTVDLEREKGLISIIGYQSFETTELCNDIFDAIQPASLDMISFTKQKRILNLAVDQKSWLIQHRKFTLLCFEYFLYLI